MDLTWCRVEHACKVATFVSVRHLYSVTFHQLISFSPNTDINYKMPVPGANSHKEVIVIWLITDRENETPGVQVFAAQNAAGFTLVKLRHPLYLPSIMNVYWN